MMLAGGQNVSRPVIVSSTSEPEVEGRGETEESTSYTAGNADNTLSKLFRAWGRYNVELSARN